MKKIYIYKNRSYYSAETERKLKAILDNYGAVVCKEYPQDADLIICIGGDGSFLNCVHKLRFPKVPILGINTGHLGFFQECSPDNLELAMSDIFSGNYQIQNINPIEAEIYIKSRVFARKTGINEIMIRGSYSHVSQFAVFVGDTKIQDFSGDGVLISTPVGSTDYNYSLGGSLVSPDIDVLQLTPVAPMNTAAYRAFHSSIILPSDKSITIKPLGRTNNLNVICSYDGKVSEFYDIDKIVIKQSSRSISLMRSNSYDYWKKLAEKLL